MSSFRHSAGGRSTPSSATSDTFSEFGQDGGNEFGDNVFEQNEGNQQQEHSKEFREKYDKQEKELFDEQELSLLLEAKKKMLEEKLKQQKLMAECNELEAKVLNLQNQNGQQQDEQQQETGGTSKAASDHPQNDQQQMMELLAKIGEMKTETNEKFGKIFEKISVLDRKMDILVPRNYWDGTKCHNDLTIFGRNNLTVHCCGNDGWRFVFAKFCILNIDFSENFYFEIFALRSVFARYSILKTLANFSDIFYFEILAKNVEKGCIFGIANKQQAELDKAIWDDNGTFGYENDGEIWINGSRKNGKEEFEFGNGDIVGIGVNLANNQLFFTKNGQRIDFLCPSNLFVCSSHSFDQLFPFVTLDSSADEKIVANFGPNFKFDLANVR